MPADEFGHHFGLARYGGATALRRSEAKAGEIDRQDAVAIRKRRPDQHPVEVGAAESVDQDDGGADTAVVDHVGWSESIHGAAGAAAKLGLAHSKRLPRVVGLTFAGQP